LGVRHLVSQQGPHCVGQRIAGVGFGYHEDRATRTRHGRSIRLLPFQREHLPGRVAAARHPQHRHLDFVDFEQHLSAR